MRTRSVLARRIDVREESTASIEQYAQVSIAFRVNWELVLGGNQHEPTSVLFSQRTLASPYVKDYDAIPDNRPQDWLRRMDTSQWRVFSAFVNDVRVGAAILIPSTDAHDEGHANVELWDMRVHPRWRRRGVARALWPTIENAARALGAHAIHVETQLINVAACRFYLAQQCVLVGIKPSANPFLPSEIQLRWRKALTARDDDTQVATTLP